MRRPRTNLAPRPWRHLVAAVSASAFVLAACSGATDTQATGAGSVTDPATIGTAAAGGAADKPRLVATTTILGDVVRNMVGEQANVDVLIPAGTDPHAFSPSAQDAQRLREADLVVANGVGLEESLGDVLDAAEEDGTRVLRVGDAVDPQPFATDAGGADPHAGEPAGDHGTEAEDVGASGGPDDADEVELDPHVWLDPVRMASAVDVIADTLVEVAPDHAAAIEEGAKRYAAELRALHASIEETVGALPPERRQLVTNHDALGYFADRYGFEVVGTVIPGTAAQADPNAADFAALAATVRDTGVPAIFSETTQSDRLAAALAAEVGRDVEVVELYTGALGEPGSGADTYVGMLTTDAERIVGALQRR